jgi:hypothetical protein
LLAEVLAEVAEVYQLEVPVAQEDIELHQRPI